MPPFGSQKKLVKLFAAIAMFIQCTLPFNTFGQVDGVRSTQIRTVSEALRSVDSSSLKELEWVRAYLEREVSHANGNAMAYCVLGIAHFREQEFDKSLVAFEQASALDSSLRTTTGKFKLLCAINADDHEVATKLFQSLVGASQRISAPIPIRKSYCEWLGEIIGTLDSPEAQSPIDVALLEKARDTLLGMPETALSRLPLLINTNSPRGEPNSLRLRSIAMASWEMLGPKT